MRFRPRHALTMFAAVLVPFEAATAMTVQPVVIDLGTSGRSMSQVITVENTFATTLPVELTVHELTLTENGVVMDKAESDDLLVFPPQALIEPGQTQTFRVQYVGEPDMAKSKHYYVTVAQLPVKLPEGQSAIQILYNFQVLVSVSPAGAKPDISVQSAQITTNKDGKFVPQITVRNASNAHGYLSKGTLRIVEKDSSGKEEFKRAISGAEIQQTIGFGLIGGDQTRTLTVPVELPDGKGTVEASFSADR